MFRYGLVSLLALLVDLGGLLILKEVFGVQYLLAATISFLGGLSVNFTLSRRWVFNSKRINNTWFEFGVFGIIGATGLIFNDLIIWALTEGMNMFYFHSKIVATMFVFFWNFLLRKYLIYR